MSNPLVARRIQDQVAWLTLARPEKRNALNLALIAELDAALTQADLDPEVRVVVIAGEGKDFCAGADLAELLESVDRTLTENEADALALGRLYLRIRALPKVVVAAVRGRALAGGAGLALACDLVLAEEGASFGFPEVQRGFVPAMVMTLLRRVVGEKAAFGLAATGRVVPAPEALRLGLVTEVVPAADFETRSWALAVSLAGISPSAAALTKRLFYELDGQGIDAGIELGAKVNAAARATPEFRRAIAAFLRA